MPRSARASWARSTARATLGWALFRQGRVEDGLEQLQRAVELSRRENIWLAQLGQAYGFAGQTEKAHEVLRRLHDPSRPNPISHYHLTYIFTGLGDVERAINELERSHAAGDGPMYGIKGSFLFQTLRAHPRFQALVKRVGAA